MIDNITLAYGANIISALVSLYISWRGLKSYKFYTQRRKELDDNLKKLKAIIKGYRESEARFKEAETHMGSALESANVLKGRYEMLIEELKVKLATVGRS